MSFLKPIGAVCVLGALCGCMHTADQSARPGTQAMPAVSLQTHHWQLQSASEADGKASTQWAGLPQPVGLQFMEDGVLVVDRLCNLMRGNYRTDGEKMQISQMVSTMMACSDSQLMALERRVALQLPQVRTWSIADRQPQAVLTLNFEGGTRWQLQGKPTYETLYGQSERIFLEVAPDAADCGDASHPGATCLKVRQVEFDAQGIKRSFGPWQLYRGAIEGYVHRKDVRNIVRIKRYTRAQPPADSSRYVDVLDAVVESEVMR